MMVRSFAELEKEIILNAIIEMGSVKQASEALKIPRRTIYRKLQVWNIMGRTWRRVKINRIIAAKSMKTGQI